MSETERIRWRCRRGLLELDLVLGRFLELRLATLSDEERDAFKALLELSDSDLWDLVAGRAAIPAGVQGRVVELLRKP